MKKKIFIFGASGLLGLNIINYCKAKKYKIYVNEHNTKINIKNINIIKINLNNHVELQNFFSKYKKNSFYVFSFIGMTSIELAEKNKKLALKTNYLINKNICDICKKTKNKFIFISTDHIFSGQKKMYSEETKPKAVNYYAKTKIKAENYIKKKNNDALIIRSNFLCKAIKKNKTIYKKSFSDSIIYNLRNKKKFYIWNDIFFTPVHIKVLFKLIFKLIENKKKGLFHISSNQMISKFDLAILIAKKLKLYKKYILPNFFDKNKFVMRPKYMTLSNKKIKKFLDIKLNTLSLKKQINLLAKDYKS